MARTNKRRVKRFHIPFVYQRHSMHEVESGLLGSSVLAFASQKNSECISRIVVNSQLTSDEDSVLARMLF